VALVAVEKAAKKEAEKPKMVPAFVPSKWETVDESELEAQGKGLSIASVV